MYLGKHGWVAIVGLLLAACGSDGPPEQVAAEQPELTGTATYDATVIPADVTAKGVAGPVRTAANSSGTNQYRVTLTQLTAPYALRWSGGNGHGQSVDLYSVAVGAGVANITPLTTLLMAQLFGQDPAAAYNTFGASGSAVTLANIADAQAKVTAYLQDVLGIQVRSGSASFITSTFQAAAGDAMFDTMQALDARLIADGSNLATVAGRIAALARLCIEEKIQIVIGGEQKEFCPASKTANPEEEDSTVLDYLFTSPTGDALTVRVRENTVLSADYVTAAGAAYRCNGIACGAIALGIPADDLTRSLTFTNTELTGDNGNILLSGTLMGAIPGIALPILPCDDNKFFAILADRTVIADCVDTSDPLGLGGTLNSPRGAEPSRAVYHFVNSSGANPAFPQIELVMDGNDSVVSVYFSQIDPDTFLPTLEFACEESACNGITLGPVTVNNDLGPETPVLIRNVTFDNTVLSGIHAETAATLKASFTTVYFVDPFMSVVFPPLVSCMPESATISMSVPSGPFNFCSAPANRSAASLDDGGVDLIMHEDSIFSPIDILIRGSEVVRVTYNSPVSQLYRCSNDCVGVTVSAPDEAGNRTVTFDGAVLYEVQSFPLPGPRTVVLTSESGLAFPPPP